MVLWVLISFILLSQIPANAASLSRYQGTRRCMGVTWTVTAFAESLSKAEKAITAALDEVSRLEQVLSDYLSLIHISEPTRQP